MGFAPAELSVSDFTDSDLYPFSGMYILDRSGAVILSSRTAEGGSFYEYARSSRYADGRT